MTTDLPSFSPCDALVAVMVGVSASDQNPRTSELLAIERAVNHTPVFANYDIDRVRANQVLNGEATVTLDETEAVPEPAATVRA